MDYSLKNSTVEFWKYKYLVVTFVTRELKSRYRQAKLGIAWAIIQPLFMTLVFTVIFSKFLGVSTGGAPYPVFSYVALAAWTFVARTITAGSTSLIANGTLIKKIYFPREVIPIATAVSAMMDFLIASTVTVVLLFLYRIEIGWQVVLLPLVLLVQMILGISLALVTSAVTIIFRDLEFAFPFLVQLLMYASPVVYSVRNIAEPFKTLLFLNPVTGVIEGYRSILVYQEVPNMMYLLISAGFAVVIFMGAFHVFKRVERYLADVI